ncbi:type II secretion system F family protein [Zhongshania aquimaris]|uniref:Type II secretion system F family protein n=1 Tax=Zhongshania aquimaris TaxID=2857107 RepID=A0ABS6VM84_9GAMM|nr:type II secretion system F family protein [Zhongshania aquimaris]MBW2939427.1 type II secretion system F family protein [Zhongshania aquimaris]
MVPVSIVVMYVSIYGIREEVPGDERDYLDPLPKSLRRVWPIVNMFSYYVGDKLPVEWLVFYKKHLERAGLNYMMGSTQYFGLQLTAATVMAGVAALCGYMLGAIDYLYVATGFLLGFLMPLISVNDFKKRRERELVKSLPVYLDFLTMATQAGLNMSSAIAQSVDKGPESPLKTEFKKCMRDLRAGVPRSEAFRLMADRLSLSEINAFVTTVIQAEKTGASIGDALKVQADQRRIERFQKAEKLAMEAPVKLIFPLVVFIFPTTFIIIFFPIGMKLMEAF